MDLERVTIDVGFDKDSAKEAVEQLPKDLIKDVPLKLTDYKGREIGPKRKFILKPKWESISELTLPSKGLSNIKIYKGLREENTDITFDCGRYHFIIPRLENKNYQILII